jgi:hypothetical protein
MSLFQIGGICYCGNKLTKVVIWLVDTGGTMIQLKKKIGMLMWLFFL